MTKYSITFSSKNKESLNYLLKFFQNDLKIQNIKTPLNYLKKKKIKKVITVLKSPHVNKTAQEQFEYNIYSIKVYFYLYRTRKYLVILKKIKNQLFPDIKVKITMESSLKNKHNLIKNVLNPNNFKFDLFKFNFVNQRFDVKSLKKRNLYMNNTNLLKRTSHYLSLLDCYGA